MGQAVEQRVVACGEIRQSFGQVYRGGITARCCLTESHDQLLPFCQEQLQIAHELAPDGRRFSGRGTGAANRADAIGASHPGSPVAVESLILVR